MMHSAQNTYEKRARENDNKWKVRTTYCYKISDMKVCKRSVGLLTTTTKHTHTNGPVLCARKLFIAQIKKSQYNLKIENWTRLNWQWSYHKPRFERIYAWKGWWPKPQYTQRSLKIAKFATTTKMFDISFLPILIMVFCTRRHHKNMVIPTY